ncbi:GerAB/ArcD/ProY family transporter [Metabacillus rhizolycopersici]|uniref:Spore germination protein n=1 Tax=Metabacillus rhizolycopersici TaxID=2875709 RepID=A0ABS7UVT0_9BACI|nr:GerAB/ArcD/ProY family transporter [Metabacillus rhizolycopersici]MBZ5752034.1 spore germination protein [Metabacillus rhizolycopersici]
MVQNKIQPIQLFVLMVLFEIGSAVIVGLGIEAKQDAWIALILGMVGGGGLFSLYVYLYLQFPTLPLTNYLEKIVGKLIGRILAIVYICLFLYIAARVLRTFSELVVSIMLNDTPILAVEIIFMLVICFGCYLGFEVIARTALILFPWIMFFSFLFVFFIIISGLIKIENLFPVLEAGWQPVLQALFPTILSFPFGESIVFAVFFPYLNNQKAGIIAGYSAIIISGITLIISSVIIIGVLGVYRTSIATFPIMDAVDHINVGDVFQRLDPVALILLIIGGFFKILIFLIGAIEGFSSLVHKPNLTKFTIPIMATIVIVTSILISDNWVEHMMKGRKTIPYILYVPLFMVIPFLLVMIVVIKKKMMKKKNAHQRDEG